MIAKLVEELFEKILTVIYVAFMLLVAAIPFYVVWVIVS